MAIPLGTLAKPMTPNGSVGSGSNGLHRRSYEGDHEYTLNEEDEEEDIDEFIAANEGLPPVGVTARHARSRLFAAFIIFGLLNNVLYVIILSAALDLVPATTPKGVVAFFNIFPALLAKVGWPLVSNGQIRYARRVGFCTSASWLGIVIIALSSSLYPRLLGISLASFSSGLGELTFLQFTTTLPTTSSSRTALGAWSSGTGFAGIAGAGIWWILRGLGVKGGLGLSSVLPLFFPLTYKFLLPPFSALTTTNEENAYQPLSTSTDGDGERETGAMRGHPRPGPPSILITSPSTDMVQHAEPRLPLRTDEPYSKSRISRGSDTDTRLSFEQKVDLVKPLLLRYMLPLFVVYIEEYVINTGVAPTLVFPVPTRGIWSAVFKSPRDYYPFWSLTCLPALPRRLLAIPPLVQFGVLTLLGLQARSSIFSAPLSSTSSTSSGEVPSAKGDRAIGFIFLLICLEGLCGGSSYVNTFYHVGREGDSDLDDIGAIDDISHDTSGEHGEAVGAGRAGEQSKVKLEREFRIGVVGAADSCGILLASLISMPLEIALCNAQVEQGRTLCRDL